MHIFNNSVKINDEGYKYGLLHTKETQYTNGLQKISIIRLT